MNGPGNNPRGAKPPGGSGPTDKKAANNTADAESTGKQPAAPESKTSGRVAFDSRGNSVWEWKTEEEGKFSRDVNTGHLKKLEATDLSLEDTTKSGKLIRPEVNGKFGREFNPYDRGSVGGVPGSASDSRSSEAPPKKPIKDLRKYDEYLKMKQRMADKKNDDDE